MILTSVLQAMGLFAATNIDDIIVLSLFFARGAGQRGTTARILAGQYLGFAGILGAAVLVTIGAGAFLPSAAIPYFGLIPLGLGLWAAWQAWRGDDDDDDDEAKVAGKKVGVWTVAGVTLANGDRKSTRLNSSHVAISYAVFCLKKKKKKQAKSSKVRESRYYHHMR